MLIMLTEQWLRIVNLHFIISSCGHHIKGALAIPARGRLQHPPPENACCSVVFGNEKVRTEFKDC